MLEIRISCEHCEKELPNNSSEAMICTYECTFCKECVDKVLNNVCPNCGGGFEKRPTRPKNCLSQNPSSTTKIHKTINKEKFKKLTDLYLEVKPEER